MPEWARSNIVGIARRKTLNTHQADIPLITQPHGLGSGYALLDAHAFRNAMNVLIARERSIFTIVVIRPQMPGGTLALGEILLRQLRRGSGDLVGYLEGAVAVALRGTDHVGAVSFADRARDEWRRAGHGNLLTEIAEHPFAEQRVIELLTSDWSATAMMAPVIDDSASPDQPYRASADGRRTGTAKPQ
ncbi:MAG: hypothetical protein DMD26_02595 [Gemmatimonadetes bacterium]|nr:MAG: hypothetical protein DMD26_02595 [Gemmatimonadota bacterium]